MDGKLIMASVPNHWNYFPNEVRNILFNPKEGHPHSLKISPKKKKSENHKRMLTCCEMHFVLINYKGLYLFICRKYLHGKKLNSIFNATTKGLQNIYRLTLKN